MKLIFDEKVSMDVKIRTTVNYGRSPILSNKTSKTVQINMREY